jgi:hypothetical protein
MPVRLKVGTIEIFGRQGSSQRTPTEILPVLDLATWRLAKVRAIARGETVEYAYPTGVLGSLWIVPEEGVASVYAYPLHAGRAPVAAVLEAWESFSNRVRTHLGHELTEHFENTVWQRWLRGEDFGELPLGAALPGSDSAEDIILDFEPYATAIAEAHRGNLEFRMPIRFRAGGVEIFCCGGGQSLDSTFLLPLLHFANEGYRAILTARAGGRAKYDFGEFGGYLLFEAHGEDVLVHVDRTECLVLVAYEPLRQAWAEFLQRARLYVRREAPEMLEQPQLARWLG